MIIDNMMPQGNKAQGASISVKIKLTRIKVIENANPVDGANEPSAIGLWRILALSPFTSRSRSAKKSKEKPPTARHHADKVINNESVTLPPEIKAAVPAIMATIAVRLRRSSQNIAIGLENRGVWGALSVIIVSKGNIYVISPSSLY